MVQAEGPGLFIQPGNILVGMHHAAGLVLEIVMRHQAGAAVEPLGMQGAAAVGVHGHGIAGPVRLRHGGGFPPRAVVVRRPVPRALMGRDDAFLAVPRLPLMQEQIMPHRHVQAGIFRAEALRT